MHQSLINLLVKSFSMFLWMLINMVGCKRLQLDWCLPLCQCPTHIVTGIRPSIKHFPLLLTSSHKYHLVIYGHSHNYKIFSNCTISFYKWNFFIRSGVRRPVGDTVSGDERQECHQRRTGVYDNGGGDQEPDGTVGGRGRQQAERQD